MIDFLTAKRQTAKILQAHASQPNFGAPQCAAQCTAVRQACTSHLSNSTKILIRQSCLSPVGRPVCWEYIMKPIFLSGTSQCTWVLPYMWNLNSGLCVWSICWQWLSYTSWQSISIGQEKVEEKWGSSQDYVRVCSYCKHQFWPTRKICKRSVGL